MLDALVPTHTAASEGGSIPSLPESFSKLTFEQKLAELKALADGKGYQNAWIKIVEPWLYQNSVRAVFASEPSVPRCCAVAPSPLWGAENFDEAQGGIPIAVGPSAVSQRPPLLLKN